MPWDRRGKRSEEHIALLPPAVVRRGRPGGVPRRISRDPADGPRTPTGAAADPDPDRRPLRHSRWSTPAASATAGSPPRCHPTAWPSTGRRCRTPRHATGDARADPHPAHDRRGRAAHQLRDPARVWAARDRGLVGQRALLAQRLGDRLGITGTEAVRLQHRWSPAVAAVAIGCDVVLTVVVIVALNVIADRRVRHGRALRARGCGRGRIPRSTDPRRVTWSTAPRPRRSPTCAQRFEADDALAVAVLTGAGGTFCAGADLKAINPRKDAHA